MPTSYNGVVTTNDNLFADAPAPGVTEAATQPSANAMMTTTN
ncbi:MAG: hypothetical protein NTW19_00905 [Planctomycetota bacterium]|nr:hypothetical protein [Planctomycetota bacterium]